MDPVKTCATCRHSVVGRRDPMDWWKRRLCAHPGLVAYLCERGGLQLQAMRRIRLGRVTLSDLPVGQWRYLSVHEKF